MQTMSTVLICEDDAFLAADLVQRVEAAGHQVQGIYASARDALASEQLPQADLAIIDLSLADGETGAAIAQAVHNAGTRVIIVSGHTNVSADLWSIPHTYAAKPVTDQLVEHLLGPGVSVP
jgi:ActR/RegA family two-component response regulator